MAPLTRRALVSGIAGARAAIHVSLVGIVGTFQTRELIAGIVTIGTVLQMLMALLVGWYAGRTPKTSSEQPTPSRILVHGAIAGAVCLRGSSAQPFFICFGKWHSCPCIRSGATRMQVSLLSRWSTASSATS